MARRSAGFVSKKPHRKSRGGCLTCKRKKVKCDEAQPACGYCALRSLDCEYPTEMKSRSPSTSSESTTSTEQLATVAIASHNQVEFNDLTYQIPNWIFPAAYTSTGQLTAEDLELLHHYKTSTWQTFAVRGDASIYVIHREIVPQLSISHSCLLYALLSIAAWHRNLVQPSKLLESKAFLYRQKTFSTYAKELQNITSDNYETILVTGTFLLALTPPPDGNTEQHEYLDWIYSLLKLSEGLRILVGLQWSRGIEKLSVYPLICRELRSLPPPPLISHPAMQTRAGPLGTTPDHPNPASTYDLPHVLPFAGYVFLPPPLMALLDGILHPEGTRLDLDANTLVPVFYVLSPIFLSLYYYHRSPDYNVRVMVFTSFLMPEFLALVKAKEPRALVLMTWFFVLADLLPKGWWVNAQIEFVMKALGWAVRERGEGRVLVAIEGAERIFRTSQLYGQERAAESIFYDWEGVEWDEGPRKAEEWELGLLIDLSLVDDNSFGFGGVDLDTSV
ncbi:hypothetical protein BDU57DRAFT_489117 [Ampelomyces quisqualis]|uniref:Zn(2)-C6 fungal-type domain-containing protein n=1 Tax=Ampelomyces quisqualis TaxID=50730 RepID=A0A6A5R2K9_AMPQU|nr:hypothetical protein BDU57DRAFT_489117 [Ampelomyces quisqualis]